MSQGASHIGYFVGIYKESLCIKLIGLREFHYFCVILLLDFFLIMSLPVRVGFTNLNTNLKPLLAGGYRTSSKVKIKMALFLLCDFKFVLVCNHWVYPQKTGYESV